ncbi:hydrogenase 4 membrane subunit [Gilliamella sp. wkB178]|uniref:hydrogenase 4 membrane subunit n=1 Tax=Gilliamella sp. wkB178 TaxID=3120259 RepID=UPI00080EE5BC|nr:hydrogenase 4 membrane subunit [Gilliamella apicola]OCG06522.1 hydrogenase 4 membrane subunit [Gilliamella apicola]
MTGSFIINNLAGLLIITSVLTIIVRKISSTIVMYSLQSLVLVMIMFAIGNYFATSELYSWAITAILTKVILVPLIVYLTYRKMKKAKIEGGVIPVPIIVILAALIMLACHFVVQPVELPLVSELKPVLAVSLGHFLIGLMCIISQRNILKQIFGYCLMENGSSLTLALLANRVPKLVEIGVTTDAIFAVVVMCYFARRIYCVLHTLDANKLNTLKG